MKKRFLLAALAVSVGTLCAQADAKPASAEEAFAAMLQPVKEEAVDISKRQSALPALAYLPAGTDAYAAFAHVGQHISRAMADGMFLDQPVGPAPQELVALESIALSMGEGSAAGLRLLLPVMAGAQKMSCIEQWMNEAKPEIAAQMKAVLEQHVTGAFQASVEAFTQQWKMKPIYAVVTLKDGQDRMVKEWSNMIVSIILASHADSAEPFEHGEFRGVTLKDVKIPCPGVREFCVMAKPCGSALVVAICANPEDVQLPGRVEDSVLASPRFNVREADLKDLFMVKYGSAEFEAVLDETGLSGIGGAAEVTRRIFETLGAADAGQKEVYDRAAAGVSALMEQINAVWGVGKTQDSMLVCRLNEQEFTMEYSTDAAEGRYEPGVLRYAAQAAAPNNILYGESTPYFGKSSGPECSKIFSAALDIGKGYALTLSDPKQKEVTQQLTVLEMLAPEFNKLGQAFSTVGTGLGNGGAVLMDAAGSLPTLFGGTKGNRVAMPRFAYCCPVSNRGNLARGWEEMMDALGGFAGKIFGNPLLLQSLSFPSQKVGDATSYCLYMPICTEHMVPNVTVSDAHFVIGSSSAYNEKLVSAGTGTMPFCGSVFSVKFEPLATTLRGIADAYRSRIPAEEEAVPMSQVDTDEGAASAAAPANASQLEKVSETLEELAVSAELAASVAECMYGTITIENGRCIYRTVVRLQK